MLKIPNNLINNNNKNDKNELKSNEDNNDSNLMDIAACIPLQALTAHYLCNSVYKVCEDDIVLIHAGAGGTGGLLIQMCKILGCKCVITTVSNEIKSKIAKQNGADFVINYKTQDGNYDFLNEIKKITKNELCNVVFDGVGKMTSDQSILSVKSRGMCVFFGNASGPVPPIDPLRLTKQGSITLTRPSLMHFVKNKNEKEERIKDIFNWIINGKLKLHIGMKFGLKDARKAHEALEGRQTTGKIILHTKL